MSGQRLDFYTDDVPAEPAAPPSDDAGAPPEFTREDLAVLEGDAEPELADAEEDYSEPVAEEAEVAAPDADEAEPTDEKTATAADDAADKEASPFIPPDDPVERAAWQEKNGIPTDGNYALPAVEGYNWTDADRSVVREVFGDTNSPQEVVGRALANYAKTMIAAEAAQERADAVAAEKSSKLLHKQLGETNAERVINAAVDAIAELGALGEQLVEARLPNGERLVNNVEIVKLLAKFGGELTLPTDRAARIAAIEEIRDTDISKYYEKGLDKEWAQLQRRAQPAQTAPERAPVARRAAATPDAIDSELEALSALMQSDIDAFMNRPWKNTGMTGSKRLYEINSRRARQR